MAVVPVVIPGCGCYHGRYKYVPPEEREAYVLYRRRDLDSGNWYIFKWRWEKLKYAATHVRYQRHDWVAYKYQSGDDIGNDWWDDLPDYDKPVKTVMGAGSYMPYRKYANLDTGQGVQHSDYDNGYHKNATDPSRGDHAAQRSWIVKVLQGFLRMRKQ